MTDNNPSAASPDPSAPAPDASALFRFAAATRATIAAGIGDPSSIYHGRGDLLEAHDREVAALLARHGLMEPPPETPEQRAARELAQHWPSVGAEIEPPVAAALDAELERLAALDPAALASRVEALRQELGPAAHAELAERAKGAAGDAWRPAAAASLAALRVLAGVADYRAAYERARGGSR